MHWFVTSLRENPELAIFLTLALGFALGGLAMMHAIHRTAGVLLIAVGLSHAVYALALLVRARHRGQDPWLFLDLRPARARVREKAHSETWMAEIDLRAFGGLEHDVKHLSDRIDTLEKAIERLEAQISALTAILNQARGARLLLGGLIAIASFLAGIAAAGKGIIR